MHRLWTIALSYYCVAFVVGETIHFTNSPGHLVGSKNFTTYKLHVKNAEPITIIEASKEVLPSDADDHASNDFVHNPNDRMDYGNADDDRSAFMNKKLVASISASHQAEPLKTQEIHESLGLVVDPNPEEQPASTRNEYKINGGDTVNGVGIKKLVYSPILLKKFVKEYTEKLKNADLGTKNAIQAISEKINSNKSDADGSEHIANPPGSEGEAEQKYNYNSFHDSYDSNRNRRPGSGNNGYKDRDGWVTLEAVPWSSSSVSKWYAYGNKNKDDRRRPSSGSYASGSSHYDRPYASVPRPDKFSYESDDDDDHYYGRPKPGHIDRDSRPNVYSTWTKPQPMGRPPRPQYNYGDSGMFNSGGDKFFDRPSGGGSHSGRPWQDDIITDNGPSNFPGSGGHSSSGYYSTKNHNDDFDDSDDGDHYRPSGSSIHASYQSRPNEGNGEWVLISTTKGYQIPGGHRQHGKRAMSLSQSAVTLNVPQVVAHKTVKLTVLPAIGSEHDQNKTSTFSTDIDKPPTLFTSHGGLLEVDATDQTIDEHVKATAHTLTGGPKQTIKPQKNIVKRRKVMKVVATKSDSDKSTEILAAVGAGMVPATMAMLMPMMVLGRKRRYIVDDTRHFIRLRRQAMI